LDRVRGAAAAEDEAPQTTRMCGRGEEQGRGADVGPDGVRILEPQRVGEADHELAHRSRRQQIVATLGMTEAWQVDRHQVCVFGQSRPHRLEGEQALGPRVQQEGVVAPILALGEADRQSVDGAELRLDRLVHCCGHGLAPCASGLRSSTV